MGRTHKKGHKIYALIVIILGIAIIALSIILLFYIQKIEVTGNEYTSSQDIIDSVEEDKYAVNSLYVIWKYKFASYKKPGSIESMKVSIKNPWTVKVKVEEKKIVGYVYDDEGYVYFDKEGTVVLKGTEFIEETPCIEGIDVSDAQLYKPLKSGDKELFETILEVTSLLKKFELVPDRIVCAEDGIHLYFGEVCVSLGTKITTEKIAQISPILEKIAGQSGTLHLERYENDGDSITFSVGELPLEAGDPEPEPPADTGEDVQDTDGTGGEDDGSDGEHYEEDYTDYSEEWDEGDTEYDDETDEYSSYE